LRPFAQQLSYSVLSLEEASHRIYVKEGVKELLNFQNVKGKAKPYQVKQFLRIIDTYNY